MKIEAWRVSHCDHSASKQDMLSGEGFYLTVLQEQTLPRNWVDRDAHLATTRRIGTKWAKTNASLILKVPSALILGSHNYLFNPNHPDANHLTAEPITELEFGPRIHDVMDRLQASIPAEARIMWRSP